MSRIILRWLPLTLAGWLAYVLLRALWTIIALGAPLYDWQWYVPVSAFLIFLPVRVVWRWPYTRYIKLLYVVLLAWIIAGYNCLGYSEHLVLDRAAPIAISFWAYTDFREMPGAVLDDLRAVHATLYLHAPTLTFDGESGQNLAAGLRRLDEHSIPVVLMPPASDFLSAPVSREWIDRATLAAALIRRERSANVRGLIGDAEPPMHPSPISLSAATTEVAQTTTGLRDLIGTLHREYPSLQVGVTASWMQYLDGVDGDADLAVFERSPVDPPGGWDFVNVMTYSSYFRPEQRAYWVASVERGMARRYPTGHISHLIGLVGGGFPEEPVLGFDDLVRDARISRALGVREIVVFQLNGALQVFGSDFVRRFSAAVNGPQAPASVVVPYSRLVSLAHYGLAAGDALLDSRGPRVWLGIGWALISGMIAWRLAYAESGAR